MSKNHLGNVYAFFFVNLNRHTITIVEHADEIIFYVDLNLKQKQKETSEGAVRLFILVQ